MLFFFSVSSLAESDASDYSAELQQILQVLNWSLKDSVSGNNGRIPDQLDDIFEYDQAAYKFLTGRTTLSNSLNYNDKNSLPYLLGSVVYGLTGWAPNSSQPLDHSLHGDLTTGNQTLAQLLALLHNISNVVAQSASTVVVSNFVSVTNSGGVASPAILAANPWWSTNSAFVLSSSNLGLEYPHDRTDNPGLFSFPEFLSAWSSRLQSPYSRPTVAQLRDFDSWWGMDAYLKQSSISEKITRNYTWFDWMADTMRTNNLLQASLLRAMLGTSNEVWNSANYVVNQLESSLGDSNFYLSNLVSVVTGISPDILAGNPWWYTNSTFAAIWSTLLVGGASPEHHSDVRYPLTFPEVLSVFLSSRTFDGLNEPRFSLWTRWGENGQNWLDGRVWTFEDFLADYLKSNMVLTSSSSYSNLVAEVSQYDTSDDSNPTNVPLPEYSLPDSETIPAASDTLTSAEAGITEKIGSLQPNYTGGDDEIVVIPAFSVGGINVPEYRARLGTSITPVCRSVASFIWYVGLFAFLFAFAKSEFVYYATLGKFWVHVG